MGEDNVDSQGRTPEQEQAIADAYYIEQAASLLDHNRNADAIDMLVRNGYKRLPTYLRDIAKRLRADH